MIVLFSLHFLDKIVDDGPVYEVILEFLTGVEITIGLRSDEIIFYVWMGVVFADLRSWF